jgi:hypothetical protein
LKHTKEATVARKPVRILGAQMGTDDDMKPNHSVELIVVDSRGIVVPVEQLDRVKTLELIGELSESLAAYERHHAR